MAGETPRLAWPADGNQTVSLHLVCFPGEGFGEGSGGRSLDRSERLWSPCIAPYGPAFGYNDRLAVLHLLCLAALMPPLQVPTRIDPDPTDFDLPISNRYSSSTCSSVAWLNWLRFAASRVVKTDESKYKMEVPQMSNTLATSQRTSTSTSTSSIFFLDSNVSSVVAKSGLEV